MEQNSFHTAETQLLDVEKLIGSKLVYVSPRILIGLQPLNQNFRTNKSAFLGLAECRLELKTKNIIHPFMEISAKTKGWIAGNEFLNSNLSCRLGIVSRINIKK